MNFPRGACVLWIAAASAVALTASAERVESDLSGAGWKLWPDAEAKWENDELFLPPLHVSQLPTNPPSGGWSVLESGGRDVSVPGTVEEYLSPGNGPAGDYKGVSWWWRTIRIPERGGAHIVLHFESQRHRAEIYLDHQLVGYDVIGGTPFEADLTGRVKPGQECQLAVRITDPGGNFDWRDSSPFRWSTNEFPMSHGFGGITGPVKLIATDPVFIDDLYLQNSPTITNATVFVTFINSLPETVHRDVRVAITPKPDLDRLRQLMKQALKSGGEADYLTPLAFQSGITNAELKPGENQLTFELVAVRSNCGISKIPISTSAKPVCSTPTEPCWTTPSNRSAFAGSRPKASAATRCSASMANASFCARRSAGASGPSTEFSRRLNWPRNRFATRKNSA
jgi:hypothetical protein